MQYSKIDDQNDSGDLHLVVNNGTDDVEIRSSSPAASTRSRRGGSTTASVAASLSEPLTSTAPNEGIDEDDDPFYVFREDLYRKLELVDEGITRYHRIVFQTDTSVNTKELKDAKKQLKRHIKNSESTLKDVQTTIQLVSSSRENFPYIDNSEFYDRKTLVTLSQDRLASAKRDMTTEKVKQKLLADERSKAVRRMNSGGSNSNNLNGGDDHNKEDDAFIADSQAKASLLMQQQDETLDELDEAVMRVGDMAGNIHEELGQQNKMLNEFEDDLADAEEKLGLVMGKLAKMLKTKDKCQLGSILGLCLTVLILLFLVIFAN